ncbi:MAG: PAS domain S-box protein [Rhodocyclaceae bacterium]|nr:MAG: PAS domain S-box protein [Rhodocyclaceae bacterium]
MPHGHCFLWSPSLLLTFVISDALIGLSYYSIPVGLLYFVRKRKDLRFNWIFKLFSVFIFACGTTHFLAIWTIWHPDYWLDAGAKVVTALASVITAVLLWPLIPRAIRLPSTRQLKNVVAQLEQEIKQRTASEAELSQLKNASDAKFHHLFDQFSVGIVEIDSSSRQILRVNRKYCEIMGYQQDEKEQLSFASATLADDIRLGLSNATGGNGQVQEFIMEKCYARKDGSTIWVNINVSQLWDVGEPPSAYVAIIKDISERKVTEQALRKQFDELQRWQKLTLGRETRVLELKLEVNQLLMLAGAPLRYADLGPDGDLALLA